jgi:hypothetical protein
MGRASRLDIKEIEVIRDIGRLVLLKPKGVGTGRLYYTSKPGAKRKTGAWMARHIFARLHISI